VLRNSSGETTLWVHEDSTEAQKSKESLGDSRVKAQEESAFLYAQRSSSRKGTRREKRRQRSEPLRTWNSSKCKKKVCRSSEEQRQPLDQPIDSGPLKISRPRGARFPISGTQTSEDRKGSPSTSRAVKRRED
jgi:hypothetical protein